MTAAINSLPARAPVTVATLVGHRDTAMAVTCLGSLVDCCRQSLQFRVHDDGSLKATDKAQLAERLGKVEFIDRQEADAQLASRLANYPFCQKMRARQIYGLKLFDVPLMCEADEIAFCDSDILFLRPFEGLFDWPDDQTGCLFMQDWQEAYAIRPWHLLPGSGIRLPRQLNCGLFFLRRHSYDLEVFEELIARDYAAFHQLPWLEQTCWGQLAMRTGGRFWSEAQIRVIRSAASVTDDLVAGHFTSPVRGLLPRAQRRVALDRALIRVVTEPMAGLTALRLAVDTSLRFLRTRLTARLGS